MSTAKIHLRLTCIALTISLSLAADWIAGPWFDIGTPLMRWTLFGLNMCLTTASLAYLLTHVSSTQSAAQRQIDLLCRVDIRELTNGAGPEFSSLPPDSSWNHSLTRLRGHMASIGQRLEELEHQRAAIESRARRLEDQAQRISAVFAGLADPVLAIDKYDEVVLSNPSADELLQLEQHSTEGRALAKLVHCEKLVELLTETRKRRTASQRSCEIEFADERGTQHWYRATARTIGSPDTNQPGNSGQGVVAVLHDISAQKAIQRRNAEFVSSVSHEMKTPLAGIKAYVELLVDGDAEDKNTQEEFLEIINSQADRLQRLVDNMLNLARIEAGVVSVTKQPQSLNELLDEALHVVQPAAEAKQITLQPDLSPLYLNVLVDRDMALQAAINLLSNAIKYTPAGGHVKLRSRLSAGEAQIDVEDNGVGLSAEDCQRVFEKFYRVQKDKDMAPGTGLGLPLVKHIIEDVHGGRIEVQSTLGRGTVFRIFLPTARALA